MVPDYAIIKLVVTAQPEEQTIPKDPECNLVKNEDLLECTLAWRRQWCLLAAHGDKFMHRATEDKYNYVMPQWCTDMLDAPIVIPPN